MQPSRGSEFISPVEPVFEFGEEAGYMLVADETDIGTWLRSNLTGSTGALQALLHRQLKGSVLLLNSLDQPLLALAACCQQVLASDHRLE